MASFSSSASTSDRPAWPSIWPGGEACRPRLEDVPPQSCRRHRGDGSVRRTDDLISLALWLVNHEHGRRQVLWFGVTAHPTAEWIANQITQACGWKQAPRYLIRDRDGAYGEVVIRRVRSMGIRDRPTSPRSPWQNAYAEWLIGSIRRECLDHVVVFGERHLRHVLLSYMNYYNETRTHQSLDKDAPLSRTVQRAGRVLRLPILGGLHHQYIRI
jgi:transposase InsO family protein